MKKEVFRFKQFKINQDRCAMKVGTDGILLGAWASLNHQPDTILDIGAGTGVIALQLAQRSSAQTIDAIEIEVAAYEQAVENFENSPWGDRLFCYHASLEEFTDEMEERYELIVSNPPFYSTSYQTENVARNTARFTTSLPFGILLRSVSKLLRENGVFATIIPASEEATFLESAARQGLYPNRICYVRGTPASEVKRCLFEFSFRKKEPKVEHLVIEVARHQYTPEYLELVKDFYLRM
ncbi:MAG: methyltransferase [Flavobacteriaceae bacterium]|nr:methyltransferase [Flavobacteriaceae bacterium]